MPGSDSNVRLSRRGACVALGAGWALFFGRVAFSSRVYMARDLHLTEIPLFAYLRERLSHGEIPQWFPYEMLGAPFAGSVIATPYHPRTLLLVFGAVLAIKWGVLLAYALGLAGAYRLCRQVALSRVGAVAGAFAFAFSGCALSYGNKLNMLHGLMAGPWMLAASVRLARRDRPGDIASLACWWALIFLGGDPQLAAECGLVAAGLLLASRPRLRTVARFGLGAALAAALASAELIPAARLVGESARSFYGTTTLLAHIWALHPLRLAELVIPHFFSDAVRGPAGGILEGRNDPFIEFIFVGGITVVLALLGCFRKFADRRVWVATAIIAVLLALGDHVGLLQICWKIFPPFARFRYPEKYMGLAMISLAPLVAAGVDGVLAPGSRTSPWILRIGLAFLAIGIVVPSRTVASALLATAGAGELATRFLDVLSPAWTAGLVQTGAIVVALALALRFLRTRAALAWLVPALLLGELWWGNSGILWTEPRALAEDTGSLARVLAEQRPPNEPPPRVLPGHWYTPPNEEESIRIGRLAGADTRADVTPFDQILPTEPGRVIRAFFSRTDISIRDAGATDLDMDLWSARFNTCYRVAGNVIPPTPDEKTVSPVYTQGLRLVRRPCLPPAYLARAVSVTDIAEALRRMKAGLPDDLVVWEGGPAADSKSGTIQWVEAAPERQKLRVDTPAPSALVVTGAYAAGWSATVDGLPTPIYPAEAVVRGILVPAGSHTVEMTYRAPGLLLGWLLSAAGLLGCLLLVRADRNLHRVLGGIPPPTAPAGARDQPRGV